MRLSVALATYNGERYLGEQLDSLAGQTRRPDELVVCDDRSTDGTREVLEGFRRSSPFPVRVEDNPERLGIIGNFERAIGLCTGDVIFLCDQDDVWAPEKLARHEQVHRSDPGIGLVFSDGAVVDRDLRPVGYTLWDRIGVTARRCRQIAAGGAFDLFVKRKAAVGCSMSFRAGLRDVLLPLSICELHDTWIAAVAAALAGVHALPERLINYRLHPSQSVGMSWGGPQTVPPATARLADVDAQIRGIEALRERLEAFEDRVAREDFRRLLREKLGHLHARRGMSPARPARLPSIFRELVLGRYNRYGSLKRDLLDDIRVG